jgi:hypothetical protein
LHPAFQEGEVKALPRWVGRVVIGLTVLIAAGAFTLSFTALTHLAVKARIEPSLAWVWPLIVDGLIVAATMAVVVLAGYRDRWYPWALLAGSAAVSVTANGVQAAMTVNPDMPPWGSAAVASVPPVVLLAVTHLTVLLTKKRPEPAGLVVKESWASAGEFLLDYLDAHGGAALAGEVIAAAEAEGFSADQVKTARRRAANPAVASTRQGEQGWLWSVQGGEGGK